MAGILASYPSLVVKQDRVTFCAALSAWDAPTDYVIVDPRAGKGSGQEVLHLEEVSSRTCRVCCPNYRPFRQNLYQGGNSRGALLAEYRRNCKLPIFPCKCCCYQTLYVADGSSKEDVGFVKEEFFVFMPTFAIINAAHQTIAYVHYETCCTGMLYDFCPEGTSGQCCGLTACCCMQPPFKFHVVNTSSGRASERGDGSITSTLPEGVRADEGVTTVVMNFPEAAPLTPTERLLYLGANWLVMDIMFKPTPLQLGSLGELFGCCCFSCKCPCQLVRA